MVEKIVKVLLETGRGVAETTSSTIEKWHYEAALRKKAELAAQAQEIRSQISVCIQRDLARSIQFMTPPDGLTYISDPRNLTFIADYNNGDGYFSFWWQKTRRKIPISESTLLSLAKRINRRIQQMPAYLRQIGYSEQDIAADYPALYNGFTVVDIQDSDDGVIVTVRLH